MVAKKSGKKSPAALAVNRAAAHNFHLLERFEAGLALTGTEVKSAREGRVNLKEAFVRIKNGEAFLRGAHFSPYRHGNRENVDPVRVRKLLLHAREIRKLAKQTDSGGLTIVPTRMYLKGGRIKLEIAVAQGKRLHDKRDAAREREARREMARARGARGVR